MASAAVAGVVEEHQSFDLVAVVLVSAAGIEEY